MLKTSAQIVSTQSLPPEMGTRFRFFGQAGRRSLPSDWFGSSQKRGTSSQILARRHTQTNTLQPFGCVTSVINKKQTSIRCNHTHWVHLKCTQIKQRQYKPDWRCTIHTPTHNVTTTPSTDNTTAPHKQTTTHPLTNNNRPKDKNIVILQININGISNKIEELKNLVHGTQPGIITIQETKLTQKAKTPKIPHYTTIRKYREHKQGGGGLITLIKVNITFTNINIPKAINTQTQNYN